MSMPTEIVIRPYVDEDLEPLVERIRELQASERRLIAACEAFARARGAQWLRINVLAANEDAVRLYRSAGFAPRLIELEMPLGDG